VPTRSGDASTRNLAGSAHGVWCGPRTAYRCTFPKDPAVAARSNSRHSNRVRRENASKGCGAIPNIPRSKQEVAPSDLHPVMTPDRKIPGTVESSGRYWADLHARCARFRSPIAPGRIPERRASVDIIEHLGMTSVAFPIDDAPGLTNLMSSWKHPRQPVECIRPGNRV
jgi:hypothetical protein